MTIQSPTLRRVGLLLGLCGIPFLLYGLGTTFQYLCCQSHPVPAAIAFSLKIEFTFVGLLLFVTGFALVLFPPLSSS